MSTNDQGGEIKWPQAADFFAWFDKYREEAGIKNDFEVARLAGLNHSSISAWRKGRQRPNAFSLSDIARVLRRSALEAWERAGLLTDADRAQLLTPQERDGVALIEDSHLPRAAKDKLKAMFLQQEKRDREERLRRLQEQIDVLGPH